MNSMLGHLITDTREGFALLRELRRWVGDGDMADGIDRSIWTPAYTNIIDRVDSFLEGGDERA